MANVRKKVAQAKKRNVRAKPTYEFEWKPFYGWLLPVLLMVMGVVYVLQQPTLLPIRSITIAGSFKHIDESEVKDILNAQMGEGFFTLDIHAIQKALGDKPWTDSVSIRRIWPSKLEVTLVEKSPVARWDDKNLISAKAIVFPADTTAFQALPLVYAANSSPIDLLRRYYSLNSQFAKLDEAVTALREDSRGALDVELSSGLLIKVGRENTAYKIDRLTTIYEKQIRPRRQIIQQIDLRYSNGLAIAWKKETLKDRDEASIWSNSNV